MISRRRLMLVRAKSTRNNKYVIFFVLLRAVSLSRISARREMHRGRHRKLKSDLAALYQTPSFMQVSVTDAEQFETIYREE